MSLLQCIKKCIMKPAQRYLTYRRTTRRTAYHLSTLVLLLYFLSRQKFVITHGLFLMISVSLTITLFCSEYILLKNYDDIIKVFCEIAHIDIGIRYYIMMEENWMRFFLIHICNYNAKVLNGRGL